MAPMIPPAPMRSPRAASAWPDLEIDRERFAHSLPTVSPRVLACACPHGDACALRSDQRRELAQTAECSASMST
jgi:hypothetical protein